MLGLLLSCQMSRVMDPTTRWRMVGITSFDCLVVNRGLALPCPHPYLCGYPRWVQYPCSTHTRSTQNPYPLGRVRVLTGYGYGLTLRYPRVYLYYALDRILLTRSHPRSHHSLLPHSPLPHPLPPHSLLPHLL